MRKLEGLVNEIVSELGYLKAREQRFSDTNGTYILILCLLFEYILTSTAFIRVDKSTSSAVWLFYFRCAGRLGCLANSTSTIIFQTKISN